MRWLDPSIIAIYIAVLAGHGIRFSRRQTSTERYFVARRGIPAWALGLSRLATLMGSFTFIAYPGFSLRGRSLDSAQRAARWHRRH